MNIFNAYILAIVILLSCDTEKQKISNLNPEISLSTDSLIKIKINNEYSNYLNNMNYGDSVYSLYSQKQFNLYNSILKIDSTNAFVYQQQAMSLYKQGKYEIGLPFLEQAVKYNRKQYLPYKGFIQCIFSKRYKNAIKDFELCKKEFGNNYEMDHTYNFYIALSYLQLNEFNKAEQIFKKDIDSIRLKEGKDWVHHLDLFYYAISLFEQEKYNKALIQFDLALEKYPKFSDAQYFKAIILFHLGEKKKGDLLMESARKNFNIGFTINDDNTIYERYPYQLRERSFYLLDKQN